MNEFFFPILLTAIGVITAFTAYRSIRRGGARFYTLEREAILRRAGFTLIGSTLFFLAAIGLLLYERQQEVALEVTAAAAEIENEPVGTATALSIQFPPTDTPTPTPDPAVPTITPTPVICRAVVEGTSFGLYLRDTPGGTDIDLLAEGSVLTLLEDEPVEANSFTWRKVRAVGGDEGWVAQDFLTIRAPCE